MKAASTDGPFGLLAACPMFYIEMLCCKFVFGQSCFLAQNWGLGENWGGAAAPVIPAPAQNHAWTTTVPSFK